MSDLRRGACPTLLRPMPTGDGLLARLHPVGRRLDGRQLAALATAAGRFGNGLLEITLRGSLQVRGLTEATAADFAGAVAQAGIETPSGVAVETGALAGIDAREIADPRPLVAAIADGIARLGLSRRLGPKVSVTVDGGGQLPLCGLGADVRIEAGHGGWFPRLGGGGRSAPPFDASEAVAETLRVLEAVAALGLTARARDLPETFALAAHPDEPIRLPVGRFALKNGRAARGVALPFGQIDGATLLALSALLGPTRALRLSPGRGLLVLDLTPDEDTGLMLGAGALGLVVRPDDPRLAISACAGAPACASGHLPARAIAAELALTVDSMSPRLHVSGCAKECGRPAGPVVALIGAADGCRIDGAPATPALRAQLLHLGETRRVRPEGRPA